MPKVLVKTNDRLFFTDAEVVLALEVTARLSGLKTTTAQHASEIYVEHSNGCFTCIKHRSGDLYPLSPREALVWILSATYFNAKEGIK